jgi:hypothetical protein
LLQGLIGVLVPKKLAAGKCSVALKSKKADLNPKTEQVSYTEKGYDNRINWYAREEYE